MRNLRDILASFIIAATITFGLGGIYLANAATEPTTPGVTVCEEDDPCWDCETMGNRICGPTAIRPTQER